MRARRRHAAIALAAALLLAASPLAAQHEAVTETLKDAEEIPPISLKGSWVAVPIPVSNPTIGTGLAAGVAYLFRLDEKSKSSLVGGGGLKTENGTWGGAAGASVNLKEGTWQVKAGVAYMDANLRFYGVGDEASQESEGIPIGQSGWAGGFQVLRRVYSHAFAGIQGVYLDLKTTVDPGDIPEDAPEIPEAELDSSTAGLGLVVTWDTRDDTFGPQRGTLWQATANFAETSPGDQSYQRYNLSYNTYLRASEASVLAVRVSGCATPGEPPFYALCLLGLDEDLRGYEVGRYRDKVMLAGQAEWRWRFWRKWGMVAFAGTGQVAESWGDLNRDDFLPGLGGGVRYALSERYRLTVGLDYARGKDSDAWYFRVGEAF
jgi:outer membrane protein assembly factor BamA